MREDGGIDLGPILEVFLFQSSSELSAGKRKRTRQSKYWTCTLGSKENQKEPFSNMRTALCVCCL
jgi:hypothetical protein